MLAAYILSGTSKGVCEGVMLPVGGRPHRTQVQALSWVALLRHMQNHGPEENPRAGSAVLTEHHSLSAQSPPGWKAGLRWDCPPRAPVRSAGFPVKEDMPPLWGGTCYLLVGTEGLWIFVLFCLNQHL